jgi:Transposase DDE domain group 1
VGETENRPFQLSFNSSLRIHFQGSRVTSDGGLVLVRELDERLGLGELIERHLADARGKNTELPLADLRQSVAGGRATKTRTDEARLSQDPTFRLIGSRRIWERGAALTSRLQSFETALRSNFAFASPQCRCDCETELKMEIPAQTNIPLRHALVVVTGASTGIGVRS